MNASDVAEYLKENPQFFEDHADLLTAINVAHSHGGHAIPIAERQVISLREQVSEIEARLRDLIRFGGENDTISEKLHRATLALFGAPDLDTTLAVIYHTLREDFGVPQVAAAARPISAGTCDGPVEHADRARVQFRNHRIPNPE